MFQMFRGCVGFFCFFFKVGSHTGRQLSLTAILSMAHSDRMVFTEFEMRRCIPLAVTI